MPGEAALFHAAMGQAEEIWGQSGAQAEENGGKKSG
jgi:hypothetical protein